MATSAAAPEYSWFNPNDGRNGVVAEVVEGDVLQLAIHARDEETGEQYEVDGEILFDKAVENIGRGNFTRIRGLWKYGGNLKRFNSEMKAGATKEDAAAAGFTGRMSAKLGLRVLGVVALPEDAERGKHTDVTVLFGP